MSCESFLSFLVGVEMEWGVFDRFLFYSFYFNLSFLFVIVPTTLTKSLTHSLILKITGSLTLKNFSFHVFIPFLFLMGCYFLAAIFYLLSDIYFSPSLSPPPPHQIKIIWLSFFLLLHPIFFFHF